VQPGETLLRVDPRYYRPTEVASLIGDATKARERLGWSPTVGFGELVAEMVHDDLGQARRDELNLRRGFEVKSYRK
jgi:GDPmannose 4,6-dehydratase